MLSDQSNVRARKKGEEEVIAQSGADMAARYEQKQQQ